MTSLDQVLNLDLREYRLLMEGHRRKRIDEQSDWAIQAVYNARATFRNKKGKLLYPRSKDLFDGEKMLGKKKAGGSKEAKALMKYIRIQTKGGKS